MALGKTVAAESLDLLKTAFGKRRLVAALDDLADHFLLEGADGADIAERRHRPAPAVGFLGREFRRLDGDPHRLLLEQRHAAGFLQDLSELVFVTALRLRALDG